MKINEDQLNEFIQDSGLVSKSDFEKAEKISKEKDIDVGKALVDLGKITEDELRRIKGHILGIPFVSLIGQKIDFDILSVIPEPIARTHNIIAFKKTPKELEVAMLDVDDLEAINFIKKKVNLKILPRLTGVESIKNALLQYQKSLKAEFGDIIQKQSQSLKVLPEDEGNKISKEDLKKIAEDLPVVRIVDTLLKHAIIQDASDIHIEPMEDKLLIRYRIDGILRDAMILPKNATASITARIKVLANLKLDEKRLPQDGRFKVDVDNQKVSFRVSVLPVYYGEKTVMRLLRESVSGFTLEALGFHGEGLEKIHNSMRHKTGMILTTGPTGSGKTTTLYTLLDGLNEPGVNISTIEDPIEYQMTRINQTQVKPEIGFSFSSGLRSLVRQDPDIIMVGEIRDNETASLAVNAALTGHLVLSTLHTNSAAGAIPRFVDMKIDPFLLVSTLDVIIAQRLVRRLTDDGQKYFLSKSEIESLGKVVNLDRILFFLKKEKIVDAKTTWSKIPFYKPRVINDFDGYSGRVGIHEILTVTPTIKDLIIKNSTSGQIEEQAKKEGMMTMIEDGIFKAVQGITTIEEVLRVVSE
ncbi:GspE/PulE family protein [Patescibacteria group bacterium]|nr:GspE/PulE family protein [Patescibacteria group bacterium]